MRFIQSAHVWHQSEEGREETNYPIFYEEREWVKALLALVNGFLSYYKSVTGSYLKAVQSQG